jgi:hypothetical protein
MTTINKTLRNDFQIKTSEFKGNTSISVSKRDDDDVGFKKGDFLIGTAKVAFKRTNQVKDGDRKGQNFDSTTVSFKWDNIPAAYEHLVDAEYGTVSLSLMGKTSDKFMNVVSAENGSVEERTGGNGKPYTFISFETPVTIAVGMDHFTKDDKEITFANVLALDANGNAKSNFDDKKKDEGVKAQTSSLPPPNDAIAAMNAAIAKPEAVEEFTDEEKEVLTIVQGEENVEYLNRIKSSAMTPTQVIQLIYEDYTPTTGIDDKFTKALGL